MKGLDPVLNLLFFGMLLFTGMLLIVEWRFKDDGQIFQTIAGVLTGLTGAFLARINPKDTPKLDVGATRSTITVEEKQEEGKDK